MEPFRFKDSSINYSNSYPHSHDSLASLDSKSMTIALLKIKLKNQRELCEDLMNLVDMFATNNVDLSFYRRVRNQYFDYKLED